MRDFLSPAGRVLGQVRAYNVTEVLPFPAGWARRTAWHSNDVLYEWGSIVSQLLAQGSAAYRIAAMYLEYKNVAAPGDTVTAPVFDRSGGVAYYDGLSASPDVDFLRVPMVAVATDSSDTSLFPGGNRNTFFAQSQGAVGVHGKPFAAANNSKIYGAALVATPDFADRTRDLVFSRFYLPTGEQQVKLATSQVGLEWMITLQ